MNKLILIDGMALIFKAYFAFMRNPLSSSKGEPTSAIFGFLSQLFKIMEDTKPDFIAIALDSKEPTYRHKIYSEYKANRDMIPEDLIPQIGRIQEIISALNITTFRLPGYEADDIIGTILKKTSKQGFESIAVTPDKDYIQLVDDNLFVIKPGKSNEDLSFYNYDKVVSEYGFKPEQMIDFLALVGDSSDNIPGVRGIGEKTAIPLIELFGSVEGIYENIDNIDKKSVKEKLLLNKDNAFLSKELATINLSVPIDFEIEQLKLNNPNFNELNKLFNELDLKSFDIKIQKLYSSLFISNEEQNNNRTDELAIQDNQADNAKYTNFDKSDVDYKLITSYTEAKKLSELLKSVDLFVFDTETDSLDTYNVNLAGVSFCFKEKQAWFIATDPNKEDTGLFSTSTTDRLPIADFIEIFKELFEDENIKKVCQNAKFDIAVLAHYGINLKGFYFDTMLASYILDPDQKHNMDDLSRTYLNYSPIPLSDLLGRKKNAEMIFDVDKVLLSNYSCEDADITFRLYKILEALLVKENLGDIAFKIEFPLVNTLLSMERAGIKIDTDSLNSLSIIMSEELIELTKNIYKFAGSEFNINSPQQLQQILFNKLNLTPSKKTKTGFSTDAQSLEQLQGEHEIINYLLDYRELQKLKSTYVDALPKMINPNTNKIHTTFSQTVASTGRLSSGNPNLQNIPVRAVLGKKIRKAFIPSDGRIFVCADYNQIELRIMASICQDQNLIYAFNNNIDIHTRTAELVFGVKKEEVTSDMRRKAKEVNFGILYGIGSFGLKNRLQITQTQAKEIIDNYFKTFKNVKSFMEESVEKAKEKGYAETILGRRRYLKNINSQNRVLRQFEERVAINMPVQGTAADMIKLAMINIDNELKANKLKSKMVLQVHDELLFDTLLEEKETIINLVKKEMESAFTLNVPVLASIGTGNNWLEAH